MTTQRDITITAPNAYRPVHPYERSVFLGGGITGCPDWQAEAAGMLPGFVKLNPRRPDFDASDPTASDVQVEWEFVHLRRANVRLFWFPAWKQFGANGIKQETPVQPIALYELGRHLALSMRSVFVGVEPGYAREFDVRKQVGLASGQKVYSTLEDLCAAVSSTPW